jgi:tetratricopeptide (TPR) repeat protein
MHAERKGLFAPSVPEWQVSAETAATEIETLASAIPVLGACVRTPDAVQPAHVRTACFTVSDWAYDNHLGETALEYAEAAAVADPGSAEAAARAGQMCAQLGAEPRAEVWYERGLKSGRRARDWEWYVRSSLRLGALRYEQGDHRAAMRCYARARRVAVSAGLPEFAGKAHHDQLLVATAEESFASGDRHARRALELYPAGYERLPYLAHDYAVLLTNFGHHGPALELLDRVLPLVVHPQERVAVFGAIARAAAGMGDRARHEAAAADVLLLAELSGLNAAGALALSAEGAAFLEDWDRALRLAGRAEEIAARNGERAPRRRAAAVLDAAAVRALRPFPAGGDPERIAEAVESFASRLRGRAERSPPPAARPGEPRRKAIKPAPPPRPWLSEVEAVEEVSPDLVAVVLWYALRTVRVLAECTPEDDPATLFAEFGHERRGQYARAAAAAPALATPLEVLARLRASPHRAERAEVALACRQVAGWGEEQGLPRLASHFAEAAARVHPESAELALAAGEACRRAAVLSSAGAWLERAYGLAVREENRDVRVAALLGHGAVLKAEGRREEARESFRRAARAAGRTGRDRQAAEAHHALMTLAAETGAFAEMDRHASAALALYPARHPSLPALAHDLGCGFLRLGNPAAAAALLELARDRAPSPGMGALCWSALAWAHAGERYTELSHHAEQNALELLAVDDAHAPAVWLYLAEAGRLRREWGRARRHAAEARVAAERLRDAALARRAEALAAAIDARVPAPPPHDGPDPARAAWLVRRMRDKLLRWRTPSRAAAPRVLQPGP